MPAERVIRDPIFDYVVLPPELAPVVDDPLFQRLRRIHQTSLTLAVYPSATGSRFEHALGTMQLASRAWIAAWRNSDEETREAFISQTVAEVPEMPAVQSHFVRAVGLAVAGVGLLHDVGHPPFSHALEGLFHTLEERQLADPEIRAIRDDFKGPFHEFAGRVLVRFVLAPLIDSRLIARLLQAIYEADENDGSCLGTLHSIVAGQYDVDRTDYLARDNNRIGTEFGAVDIDRLIGSFELHQLGDSTFAIAPSVRARSAVETLLIQRVQSYRWVTFHPRVVGSNVALARASEMVVSAALDWDESLAPALREVFRSCLPNLNYLDPSSEDLARTTGRWLPPDSPPGSTPPLPLADDQVELRRRLVRRAQSAVDDDTISEMLKAALQRADLLYSTADLDPTSRQYLERLLTFAEAALFRKKNFLVLWKTTEEYAESADETWERLMTAVAQSFDEVIDGIEATRRDGLTRSRDLATERFSQDPVDGFNYVVRALLSDPVHVRRLANLLHDTRSTVRDNPGAWVLHYQPFTAVGNSVDAFATDNAGARNLVDLRRKSQLIDSLQAVERTAPTLFGFFFLQYPHSVAPWGSDDVWAARSQLRRSFAEVFPTFVRGVWPHYLETEFERKDETDDYR